MSFQKMLSMAYGGDTSPQLAAPPHAEIKSKGPKPRIAASPDDPTSKSGQPSKNSPFPGPRQTLENQSKPSQGKTLASPNRSITHINPARSDVKAKASTARSGKVGKAIKPTAKSTSRMTGDIRKGPSVVTSKQTSPKKMSFGDMMKKARSIDKEKLKMTIKTKDKEPALRQKLQGSRLGKSPNEPSSNAAGGDAGPAQSKHHGPAPVAQPFPELLRRQEKRRSLAAAQRQSREEDSDFSDFIVSDSEEIESSGYPQSVASSHREEIWSMFNRKPRNLYDDDDSADDMEATGRDILDEEKRSTKFARREDIEEEHRLQELAARKRQRLNKSKHQGD